MSEYIALGLSNNTIVVGKTVINDQSYDQSRIALSPSIIFSGDAILDHSKIELGNIPIQKWAGTKTGLKSKRMVKDWTFQFECDEKAWDHFFDYYFSNNFYIHNSNMDYKNFIGCSVSDTSVIWYKNGKKHHENDLPAVEFDDGGKEWWVDGKLHRDNDLPAIILNGSKSWVSKGLLHREGDLPAIEEENGSRHWYKNGVLHREKDLPAQEFSIGSKYWWLNGKLHRLNGPAVIGSNGDEQWYEDGKKHRKNGPAVKYARGYQEWWTDDQLHNLNGPAKLWNDAAGDLYEYWYINGKEYSNQREFNKEIQRLNKGIK